MNQITLKAFLEAFGPEEGLVVHYVKNGKVISMSKDSLMVKNFNVEETQ